jgi:hypothetical protein
VFWIWICIALRRLDLDPDPDPGGQKWPTILEKSEEIYVLKCWMFSLRAEDFSSILKSFIAKL